MSFAVWRGIITAFFNEAKYDNWWDDPWKIHESQRESWKQGTMANMKDKGISFNGLGWSRGTTFEVKMGIRYDPRDG